MRLYDGCILPRLTDLAMRLRILQDFRQRTLSRAEGAVLELGFGSGLNLPFYNPRRVSRLFALEPAAALLRLAQERIQEARFPVEVLQTGAERIPLPDHSVDTALCTWTLCTIPNVEAALDETRRVLKPNGRFLFAEHGRSDEPGIARWQDRLTPAWKRFAGGCHLNRNPESLLKGAGFDVEQIDKTYIGWFKPITYMYVGRAAPRARFATWVPESDASAACMRPAGTSRRFHTRLPGGGSLALCNWGNLPCRIRRSLRVRPPRNGRQVAP